MDPTLPLVSYWARSEREGNPPSLRYAMASSTQLEDLWTDTSRFRIVIPFGVPPAYDSVLRVWSGEGGPASGGGPGTLWPVECVGLRPDIDGDALLDDCDPFPTDGPLADFDDDGVLNHSDNCPATPNADQTSFGRDPFRGAACDPDDNGGNFDRILFATVTVDDMNDQRVANGLDPIVWPVVDPVLRPDVAAWCDSVAEIEEAMFADDDDALPDNFLEFFQTMVASLPDAYGLEEEDKAEFVRLTSEVVPLWEQIDSGTADWAALEGELKEYERQLNPYYMLLDRTDQSCEVER